MTIARLNGPACELTYRNWYGVEVTRMTTRKAYERWSAMCGRIYRRQQINKLAPRYYPCSGQGKGKRFYGIRDDLGKPWWRLEDARGRTALFTMLGAYKRANELNIAAGHPGFRIPDWMRETAS